MIGKYETKIDNKRRIFIPSQLRSDFNNKVLLLFDFDHIVIEDYEAVSKIIDEGNFTKDELRYISLNSKVVPVDKAHRVILPENYMTCLGICDSCTLLSVNKSIEVWNEETLQNNFAEVDVEIKNLIYKNN